MTRRRPSSSHAPLRTLLLALAAGMLFGHAQAQTAPPAPAGPLRDLQVLVERQEFAEAVQNLRSVPPAERGAVWDRLAVQAAVGQAGRLRRDGCDTAYDWLRGFRLDQGSGVAGDPALKRTLVDLGLCALKDRRAYQRRPERDKLAAELRELDPGVGVRLYAEGGYEEARADVAPWIAANTARARTDEALKASVLAAASRQPGNETPAQRQERYRAMRAAGWYDGWVQTSAATLNRIGAEMARGIFNAASGESLALALVESGAADDTPAARVLVPPAVRLSSARDPSRVQNLAGLSARGLKTVEDELLRARPDEGFWFEGPSWDEGTALADITRRFPALARTAREECARYRKGGGTDGSAAVPVHTWRSACEWLAP